MRRFKFIGSRIGKTGISVFLTAIICEWIGWPPVFAVITAIVTIEPTVSDSIKKGIVRFPASAIGSAYAVLFISLLGNSALTYTLAAVLTITTCYKLKLHAGLLVATLTAVAMVEVIHSNFLISFFIRLGTTTIGLGVSMIVNMFIFPPDYRDHITKNVQQIAEKTSIAIEKVFKKVLTGKEITYLEEGIMEQISQEIQKTEQLSRFQNDEEKYHPLAKSEEQEFQQIQTQLNYLRTIHYHMNRLISSPIQNLAWSEEEQTFITDKIKELIYVLQNPKKYDKEHHHAQQAQLMELFWLDSNGITADNRDYLTKFPPEIIILYELLSIYELVDDYLLEITKQKE